MKTHHALGIVIKLGEFNRGKEDGDDCKTN